MVATDNFSLAAKVAVITGAGKGIGRAIALAFAQAGAAVACVDLDAKAAESTVAAVANNGQTGFSVGCDVSNEADVETAAKAVFGKFSVRSYSGQRCRQLRSEWGCSRPHLV